MAAGFCVQQSQTDPPVCLKMILRFSKIVVLLQAPQFSVNFAAALQTPASSQPAAAQAVATKPANGSTKQPAVTVSNPAPTVQVGLSWYLHKFSCVPE